MPQLVWEWKDELGACALFSMMRWPPPESPCGTRLTHRHLCQLDGQHEQGVGKYYKNPFWNVIRPLMVPWGSQIVPAPATPLRSWSDGTMGQWLGFEYCQQDTMSLGTVKEPQSDRWTETIPAGHRPSTGTAFYTVIPKPDTLEGWKKSEEQRANLLIEAKLHGTNVRSQPRKMCSCLRLFR